MFSYSKIKKNIIEDYEKIKNLVYSNDLEQMQKVKLKLLTIAFFLQMFNFSYPNSNLTAKINALWVFQWRIKVLENKNNNKNFYKIKKNIFINLSHDWELLKKYLTNHFIDLCEPDLFDMSDLTWIQENLLILLECGLNPEIKINDMSLFDLIKAKNDMDAIEIMYLYLVPSENIISSVSLSYDNVLLVIFWLCPSLRLK